ncbi:MAG: dTDP-4-dehydrorhamnose reductase [Chlorobiaceae bacterium]|nr:dTDP-4-dehydrorhamnose reductase [Chlorobiaceae bacterium]
MNILVTGSRGQLGSEIHELSPKAGKHRFFFFDLPELDITDPAQVEKACAINSIQAIVNCAAYTAVDRAETDAEAAYRVNRDGAAVLAACAARINALLVHISTDYVFDGKASLPYRESDPVNPLGVYGKSKWEGEERIREIAPSHIIIRTSWLYSGYGANFVKTMLRLGRERDTLNVVFDQIGSPTSASDLAEAVLSILDRAETGKRYSMTFHYADEGVCSWYDFAVSIMEMAGLDCTVLPVDSTQYPQAAQRPHFSVMDKSAVKREWGLRIPHWSVSLARQIEKILKTTSSNS